MSFIIGYTLGSIVTLLIVGIGIAIKEKDNS